LHLGLGEVRGSRCDASLAKSGPEFSSNEFHQIGARKGLNSSARLCRQIVNIQVSELVISKALETGMRVN
jgi:hypothetical protein